MNHGLFFLSFMDLLWYGVMEAEWDHERIEKLIMVTWPIWTNRNEVRNGGVRKGCRALYHGAMDYLGEYQASPVKLATSTPVLASHWTLPPHMRYKMNVDGAVFGPQKAANVAIRKSRPHLVLWRLKLKLLRLGSSLRKICLFKILFSKVAR